MQKLIHFDTNLVKLNNNDSLHFIFKVRSRIFNLKDKKNIALRENVLFGIILPEKIAAMTSEEMASDEVSRDEAQVELKLR